MYGVFKVHTRPLLPGPGRPVKKLVGVFRDEAFAIALIAALCREQLEAIGTILDEYEIREIEEHEAAEPWPDY